MNEEEYFCAVEKFLKQNSIFKLISDKTTHLSHRLSSLTMWQKQIHCQTIL